MFKAETGIEIDGIAGLRCVITSIHVFFVFMRVSCVYVCVFICVFFVIVLIFGCVV